MALRLVEIYVDAGHADTVRAVAEQSGAVDCFVGAVSEDGRQTIHLLVSSSSQQEILDKLQTILSGSEGWRVVLLPVEAALPEPPAREEKPILPSSAMATREELLADMRAGARLDRGYIVLTALSTIVAAIGLLTDSIAVIIGAMVIAPLLGPNLAFAFSLAVGDQSLTRLSVEGALTGLGIAVGLSALVGIGWPDAVASAELVSRTHVGYEDVALALASGAAAVLSLTTGVSATLVGVMVAVALLPPVVALGMFAGAAQWLNASGALILLAVNIVCINLAAQIVFAVKRLGPRTIIEQSRTRVLVIRNIAGCVVILLLLSALIYWRTNLEFGWPFGN